MKANRSGIDECQLVPGVFPALKVRIGTSQIPGRFILSGSVRFTSRRAIRESLTGRISNLELYPFVLTEIEGEPNSSFLFEALQATRMESLFDIAERARSQYGLRTKEILKYLEHGGLPGLFHIRERNTRNNLLRDLTETILDRDLRLVYRTSLPYQRIHDYCAALAFSPLQIIRPGSLRKSLRIAESTQQHLLYALESVFLIRRIPVEGDYQGDLFWFEDQCERKHFASSMSSDDEDWITLIYRNARAQFNYRVGEHAQYFHYKTRGGAQVPLAIRTSLGVLGIICVRSHADISLSLKRSADSFLKRYNHSKVLFLTREGNKSEVFNDRLALFPVQAALF
ncbi:MAG: ATP-binding protein, partial [Deltaproteobacteria bacterium]|nr:ATP-binding protein [Deltaproteobacteria bacterium]